MTETQILELVVFFLVAFVLAFALFFEVPWYRMRSKVRRATAILNRHYETARAAGGHVTDIEQMADELSFDAHISHLWKEFRHTLHAERSETEFDEHGHPITERYRQTVPAELYFSTRTLIDVPLRTDFFKHLPGILTGLGIIGTFGGLITGLAKFGVSGDADKVNENVASLVGSVRDAFLVSAVAITLSILITALEKMSIASLHRRVQRLQNTIDRMFDAGAGEDYLSEIARGTEQSTTHLAHLKEGLVNDLKHLLDDFAERQNAATRSAAEMMANRVTDTLEAPLSTMASAMERSLEDQQAVVHRLMDQSLDAFAVRLEEMVGAKLTDAASHVEAAAGTMREALDAVPARIDAAAARVESVLEAVARNTEPIAANAERIGQAADHLATTVEQSAETLDYAIGRFKRLGEELGGSLASAEEMARSLQDGTERASQAAEALAGTGTELENAQVRLSAAATSLSEVADRSRHDGEAHAALARAVEQAAAELGAAQRDVNAFLQGIAGALTETHETFSREISATLNRSHESFHHSLANATERLAGTVHSFGEFLETDFKDSVDSLQQEFARLSVNTGNGHPES
jgi:uncharacterized protein YoxC